MTVHSPTQRKQQGQYQEKSTAGRYHIAEAVHSSTRMYIPTTDLGHQRLEDRGRISKEPNGQHSPSTATSSRGTLGHDTRYKTTTHAFFQQ